MPATVDPQSSSPGGHGVLAAKPTSVKAILGLILGFFFWPAGLVLSILGMRETKPDGSRSGRGLAIAGLIVSILAAIVGLLVFLFVVVLAGAASTVPSTSDGGTASATADPSTPAPSDPQVDEPTPDETTQAPAAGSPEADVVVDGCTIVFGNAEGEITVTNSTDSAASYFITLSANDADGNRVGELNASANAVAPGQSAKVQAYGLLSEGASIESCVIAEVTRF